jgi:hypothetical protein
VGVFGAAAEADERRAMIGRRLLWALLALSALIGATTAWFEARGTSEPPLWTATYNVAFGALTFGWVYVDSQHVGYRRSPLLNLGIVLLAFVAVPYYLLRSRPAGARLRALAGLAGFFALLTLAATAGYTLLNLLS